MNKNIGILSPNRYAYSETFIQAHKERLGGRIYYYYGSRIPNALDGSGPLLHSRWERIVHIMKGKWHLNEFSLAEAALLKSFKANKIDVALAEYGFTGQEVYKVCAKLKIPLIIHFHGYDASRIEELESNNYYKEAFEYASYIIVVSKKMYEDLLNWGCPENKLQLNIYGPKDDFFNIKPKFEKPQFVSVGRFVDKKAPYYLILSFLKVLRQFPDAQLIMGANGRLLPICKHLVDYFDLNNNIKFVGVISPNEFKGILEESIALIQHSITAENGDTEGTPVSILEAGAAGLPVISTYHAGIPDVIIHGENGLLVEEHDVDGMAENMCRLLREPAKAKVMGDKARMVIEENFTMENHIKLLDELIERAVRQ